MTDLCGASSRRRAQATGRAARTWRRSTPESKALARELEAPRISLRRPDDRLRAHGGAAGSSTTTSRAATSATRSRHLRRDRGLRTAVPYLALSTLVERGLVPEGEALLDDYRFLQRASLRLRLLRDEPDDRLDPRDHAPLARSLGLSQEALLEELRTRMARIRQVWNQALD